MIIKCNVRKYLPKSSKVLNNLRRYFKEKVICMYICHCEGFIALHERGTFPHYEWGP